MRIFKSHPLVSLVNGYLVDSPQPSNLSYLWNFGSLLAFCLIIQIITGVTLAMHYNPSVLEAFNSVEHIMRDVNNGWLIRYLHSNTASAFFFLVYLHIGRGLYYGSYKAPRTLVWTIGTVIFILMMATSFLGYNISPKWLILNLSNISTNENFTYVMVNFLLFLFIINFTVIYLNDFKYSSNRLIKPLQILILFNIPLLLILLLTDISITDFVCFIKDENSVNLHGHVNVTKDAATELSKGINTVGTQIGLGATMVGASTAVGKAVAKSSIPPLQKAGFIVGSGLTAGLGHSMITTYNRAKVLSESVNTSTVSNLASSSSNVSSNVNKFLGDSQYSPLQYLLFQFEAMDYVCLSLIYLLIIQLVFKLYFKDNVNLNLSELLGNNFNSKMEYYLNKVIRLNKRMSTIWIWFGLIVLILGLSISTYIINNVYINIDNFINLHNLYKSSYINNDMCITKKSIINLLFNLLLINYLSITIIIFLIMQLAYKLHFKDTAKSDLGRNSYLKYYLNIIVNDNKNILLMLVLLVSILVFSAYMSNELYNNLDYYIVVENNIYKNIIPLAFISKFKSVSSFNKTHKKSYSSCNTKDILSKFLTENKLNPMYSYNNLHLDYIRKIMLKDLANLSGIYIIFNKVTGDYYIGSASTDRFYARFSNHLLYFKGSKILKNAVKKYGMNNFSFLVLELFPEVVTKENNKKLLDLEDFYLKSLLPNYNILTEAGSSFGYKHTELSRIKIKDNYSIHRRNLIGDLNKGKELSEDTKSKIREKMLSKGKRIFSDKALMNMKKKSKAIILYNLDRTVFGQYLSIKEAAKSINCNEKTIIRTFKTDKKILKRRFIVDYINKK